MRVGFRRGLVLDEARRDWDGHGPRPISWAAWYPADDDAVEAELITGGPSETWFTIGAAARDAPLRQGTRPWPVVVASHGTGGTALSLGWLGRRLAQHGYVVLTPNHHGNTAVEPYRPEGFLCWWERARDLSVLLDHIASDDVFNRHVDTARAWVAGFSLGGYTALAALGAITDMERFRAWAGDSPLARGPREFPDLADRLPDLLRTSAVFRSSWERQSASYGDERLTAALLLAPAPPVRAFTQTSLAEIAAPVHVMIGGADREAPAEVGAFWLAERLRRCTLHNLGPSVGHFVFLPEATDDGRRSRPELCRDAPGVDRRAIHEAVVATARAVFSH